MPLHAAAPPPVRVLILTGQNNHDWRQTTPKLKSILASSGRFVSEVTEHPEQCDASTFSRFDVVLSDWNAWGDVNVKEWPARTRRDFLNFVRAGGGLVVVHAGSSSFYDWSEYQQLAGASWKLGQTSHGAPHEFTVEPEADHPVTRGLRPFQTKDELWIRPGVHPDATVLARAEGHPVALATTFGKGRGFTLLLGHSADFMTTPGFQSLLRRGTEWAATGRVTSDLAESLAPEGASIIGKVASWRWGESRQSVLALEKLVFAVSPHPGARQELAAALASALTGEGTAEGRSHLCQALSVVGSDAEVPALAKALAEPALFDHARQALERIPGPKAEAALRSALETAAGAMRIGLMNSLAARRSLRAVPDIARLVTDPDEGTSSAALAALGAIGGETSAAALAAVADKMTGPSRETWASASLRCAPSLPASSGAALLEKLVAVDQPAHIRVAAFPHYVGALGERGADHVLAALTGQDATMRHAAVATLRMRHDPALLRAGMSKLEQLPPELQAALIVLCGETSEAAVLPTILRAASQGAPAVKFAAIQTLGSIGDKSVVAPLVQLGGSASEAEQQAVFQSLSRIRGHGVEAALIQALRTASPPAQRLVIRALATRGVRGATAELLELLARGDASVRRDAAGALGQLANAEACRSLVPLLARFSGSDQAATESALVEICRRDPAAAGVLAAEMAGTPPASQATLVGVLGSVGGAEALAGIRRQLKSEHAPVRLAAVRALADWPDAAPLEDLAGVVETTAEPQVRAIAARGLNRMAPQAPQRAARAAEALSHALAAATDVAEQRSYLAALAGIPSTPSLQAARTLLGHSALGTDAATALLDVAAIIYPWHRPDVRQALAELQAAPIAPALAKRAEALAARLDQPANLAMGGLASSPDGLEKDGEASGDHAAIDGDPKTYWDEENNQKTYRLRVQLRERSTVGCLRILAWAHHNYAARDFEVLCDDKVVKRLQDAQYADNWLVVEFPSVECEAVELRITGYYGQSPAIRELEIYSRNPAAKAP